MCERDSGGCDTWCQKRRAVSSSKSGSDSVNSGKDENNNDIASDNHKPWTGNSEHRLSFGTDYNNKLTDLDSCSRSNGSINDTKSQTNKLSEALILRKNATHLVPPVVLMILLFLTGSFLLPGVESVCVWQGGGSYRLACGFRQSGLFRIRSLGGLKFYGGGGFTIGDEEGFKDSLTNTDPVKNTNYGHTPQGQGYPNGYQRVGYEPLPTPLAYGNGGVPLSLEQLKKQEQLRYLQQIQAEQMLEHQVLQQQASMQSGREQKQLFQSRRLPVQPPSATPSRSGGITKRGAARWGWPFQKKPPGNPPNPGSQIGERRMNSGIRPSGPSPPQGPPPGQRFRGRGPPPRGPPQSLSRPMGSQSQNRPVLVRGPFPGQGQSSLPSQNPFQNQLGPFPRQFQPFPARQGSPVPGINRQGLSQDDYDEEDSILHPPKSGQKFIPNQMMMPPPSPSGPAAPQQFRPPQFHQPEDVRHLQLPNPGPSQIPKGLQMLQNTENYGSVFQLVDQNNRPKSFQNSHHVRPPSAPVPTQNVPQIHRTLATGGPTFQEEDEQNQQQHPQLEDDQNLYLSGLGTLDKDALRTAVYDPNIFPDIYFTTTERGSSLNSGSEVFDQSQKRNDFMEDEDFLHPPLDTAALHTNEAIDRVLEDPPAQDDQTLTMNESDVVPSPRKKGKRRRKKFRILKKTGQVNSDVSQNLDDVTDEASASLKGDESLDQAPQPNVDEGGGEIESQGPMKKLRRRKKGRRRKKPVGYRLKKENSTSSRSRSESELIREAISSGRDEDEHGEELPISGPSPLTLTFPERKMKTTTPTTTTSTTTTTTTTPVPMTKFGYHEALDKKEKDKNKDKNKNPFSRGDTKYRDNDESSSGSSKSQSVEQVPYDPRFPPNHEINKGRSPTMNKFIRPRGPGEFTTTTPTPFISGGLNVLTPGLSGPSLSFSSPSKSKSKSSSYFGLESPGSTAETVKFSPSTELSSSFVKFDSRESIKSIERTKLHNDKFYSHFNKSASSGSRENNHNFGPTAFSNPGYYDASTPFSQERGSGSRASESRPSYQDRFDSRQNSYQNNDQFPPPPSPPSEEEHLLPWEQQSFFSTSTRTPFGRSPVPIYPRKSNTVVFDRFGPTSPSITYPTTAPSAPSSSDLKKILFSGDEDDGVSNWEAPNFWGSIQQVDRYGPTSDFVTNDNFKRVLEMEEQARNSFQDHGQGQTRGHSREQGQGQGPTLRPPPEPPSFDHDELRNFHSFFESTPNSISDHEERWDPQRKSGNNADFGYDHKEPEITSPSPFYNPSSTTFHPDLEAFEQLPVKELDLDDFGPMNNFNFISSTSTTQAPEVIKNIRIKHARGKKRKQKRPEVSIKNRGDNQPPQPESTPTPVPQEKNFVNEPQDSRDSGSEVRNSAQNGFDGNFIPSSTPFLKEHPFSNFDSVIPQNPFGARNQNSKYEDLNRHINQMTGFDGGQGQMSRPPPSPPVIQHRESSEERRQFAQPNSIPEFGSGSPRSQPNQQHDHNPTGPGSEDSLPNIVPSPPDPMLDSEVVPFGQGNDKRFEFQFPTSIPVLKPPNFDIPNSGGVGGSDLRWDAQQNDDNNNPDNERIIIEQPRKVVPQSIQILNIQNPPQQSRPQPQPQPPKMPPMNNDFYSTDFRNFQQNFPNREPGSFNHQPHPHQHPQNPEFKMKPVPNQERPFNNGQGPPPPPSIKLVQNHFQGPPQQTFPYEESFKMFKMPQNPNNNQFQSQTRDREPLPFQLVHPTPPKTQFQKHSPPKKYGQPQQQQDKGLGRQQISQFHNKNSKNNIPLPKNPYMSQNNLNQNNFKKQPNQIQHKPAPTKIPAQKFQPPPPPTPAPSFLSRLNPFNRGSSSSNSGQGSPPSSSNSQKQSQSSSNQHINPYNNRFQPPPPAPTKGVEVTYVDLDDNLNPPRLVPHSAMSQNGRGPPPQNPPRSRGPPPPKREDPRTAPGPMSEKDKVLQAIATLNNVKYDVIQSVAEEQFGTEILERIKAKKAQEYQYTTTTTPRPSRIFPILTTMAPMAGSFLGMMSSAANAAANSLESQSPQKQHDNQRMSPSGLSNLLASFGGYGDSAVAPPVRSPTITSLSTDAITNLFNSLTSGENSRAHKPPPTIPATTTSTPTPLSVRLDAMIENSGGSMELLNMPPNQDIKSLQAQLAKAILAKANRKKSSNSGPTSPNPLGLIGNLAQTKNYTQAQISTLKKLIALNNIEQKLNHQLGLGGMDQTTPKFGVGHTMKSLLSPSGPSGNSNIFSNKMLGDPELQMLNTVQSSGNDLHNDPTLLALKAYALKKAQSIQVQPNVSFNQRRQDESSDFRPIPVDLSAILSPAPPLEEPRKRRLTDVRNAPKSFYPANATSGFDHLGSGPGSALSTEFSCEGQNFFPGLYADMGLGCKVFHLCAKTDAGYLMKSFRCPKETVFDNEVLKCNWSLYVDCDGSESKYHFNKYLSQSFQFLKVLGEFNKNATAANG